MDAGEKAVFSRGGKKRGRMVPPAAVAMIVGAAAVLATGLWRIQHKSVRVLPAKKTVALPAEEPQGASTVLFASAPPAAGADGESRKAPPEAETLNSEQRIFQDLDREILREQRNLSDLKAGRNYFQQEDAAYRRLPRFEEIREEIRGEALRILAEQRISAGETEKVLAAAGAELELFWKEGGLDSPEAFRHGLIARAMAEEAVREGGTTFAALETLKETITSANPDYFADKKPNEYALNLLGDVLQKQKEIVIGGGHPVDAAAFYAFFDWIEVRQLQGKSEDTVPAWQWLLDNAGQGGWQVFLPVMREGIEAAARGQRVYFNAYVYPGRIADRDRYIARRRLPSFPGASPVARKVKANVWEEGNKIEPMEKVVLR